MLEGMNPKTLARWLLLAALLYLLLPFDLIPDFLGVPGRIDDLLAMGLLAWFYRGQVRQQAAAGSQQQAQGSAGAGQRTGAQSTRTKGFDAYEILGVSRNASSDAIQAAYRARMQEYHPDKVAHLGVDLQKLAHEKSQEIQRAYQQLRG